MRRYKNHIAFFISTLMLLQGVSLGLLYSQFQSNAQSIEEKFCVNKERTDFDCGGQCYFMKKINGSTTPSDFARGNSYTFVVIQPVFFEAPDSFAFSNLDIQWPSVSHILLQDGITNSILKPPRKA